LAPCSPPSFRVQAGILIQMPVEHFLGNGLTSVQNRRRIAGTWVRGGRCRFAPTFPCFLNLLCLLTLEGRPCVCPEFRDQSLAQFCEHGFQFPWIPQSKTVLHGMRQE